MRKVICVVGSGVVRRNLRAVQGLLNLMERVRPKTYDRTGQAGRNVLD